MTPDSEDYYKQFNKKIYKAANYTIKKESKWSLIYQQISNDVEECCPRVPSGSVRKAFRLSTTPVTGNIIELNSN